MTPRDLRNIHTTGNSCRDTLPCASMAKKTLISAKIAFIRIIPKPPFFNQGNVLRLYETLSAI